MNESAVKVGVIAEQTGPLSFMGIASANVAKMVIDDISTKGGLLGRKGVLYLEDSATSDSMAEAKAAKLVQQDQVDVIFGGIHSSWKSSSRTTRHAWSISSDLAGPRGSCARVVSQF